MKYLATSTALALVLLTAPAQTDLVSAKERGGSASNSSNSGNGGQGDRGKSSSAPGHNKGGSGGDANRGHGNDPDGFDEGNPGKSTGVDREDDDGDEVRDERTRQINLISTLRSPKKLSAAMAAFDDLENPNFVFEKLDDQELDIIFKGGSPRSIENALRRNPEVAEQIDQILEDENLELADVVGISVTETNAGDVVTIFYR